MTRPDAVTRPDSDLNFEVVEHLASLEMRARFVSQQLREQRGPSRYARAELQALAFVFELAAEDYPDELSEARARAEHRWRSLVEHRAQQRALEQP